MTRKKTDKPTETGAVAVLAADGASSDTALAVAEQDARVTALARQLNYQGSTAPDVLENGAREAIRRIGMSVFELGAYLLLLREACPHGEFLPTLDRLGMAPRAAQQYMSVSRRFSNAKSNAHLEAAGIAKLAELVALENDQIDELLTRGQTGELALDDVATMSVKELRAAVREARAEHKALEEVTKKKSEQIDKLKVRLQRIQKAPPDEALVELKREAAAIAADAQGAILGGLRDAVMVIRAHAAQQGEDGQHDVFLAGLVGQVQDALSRVRHSFDLPDVSRAAEAEARWLHGHLAKEAAGAKPQAQG